MAVFWVVAPCGLVEIHWHFRGACCLNHQCVTTLIISYAHRPDDGGSKHLWNVGKLLPDYTVLQPRRQPSSYNKKAEKRTHLSFSLMPITNEPLELHVKFCTEIDCKHTYILRMNNLYYITFRALQTWRWCENLRLYLANIIWICANGNYAYKCIIKEYDY
jgi:hypothetical protein